MTTCPGHGHNQDIFHANPEFCPAARASSMTAIEALEAERQRLHDEFARVGKPLLDQAHEVSEQIMNLKREAGQLFYVEYMRYHTPYTEECETLEEAKGFAEAMSDNGSGYVTRIHGPETDLQEGEWY